MSENVTELTLEQAATYLLEECRMVLPGIQALFGFQLVAVFNSRFAEALSVSEQRLHLAAIVCVVVSIALVMAPAALHRQREPNRVSKRFLARVILGDRGLATSATSAAASRLAGRVRERRKPRVHQSRDWLQHRPCPGPRLPRADGVHAGARPVGNDCESPLKFWRPPPILPESSGPSHPCA